MVLVLILILILIFNVAGPRAPHVVRAPHIQSFILLPVTHLEYSISISDIPEIVRM